MQRRDVVGKQINFYMNKDIEEKFIEYLNINEFNFLDYDFKNNKVIVLSSEAKAQSLYLYKKVYGDYFMQNGDLVRLDIIKSPVIEFTKTQIKEESKKVKRGRLWLNEQYYNEEGTIVKKDTLLIKDFNSLVRWIKKNVPYQEIKKGEHYIKEYANDEIKKLGEEGFILTI